MLRLLREGDLVALVAPSGWVRPERVAAQVEVLQSWGLRARVGEHAMNRRSYLSATDDERRADFNAALRDDEVRGIWCLRGGYGAQRIVDGLDFAAARADPRLVIGFSDITAIHLALWCEAGLATVHGPTASYPGPGEGGPTEAGARRALMSTGPVVVAADPTEDTYPVRAPGRASGVLLGGNLTILAATAGTRHRPDLRGAILLVEDVHDEPYRVDRCIVQLERAGWLDGIAGVAVGQFTECVDPDPSPTTPEVLTERFGSLGVPVLGGLPIGHGAEQIAVGLGVPAVLDVDAGTLTVSAV
ncbi:LD-carboxypeptidase, partial [Actinoplanes sp. NPDC051633]|uniref:S66 peptidase family protein n=1 Tax=Actinoplanes sp. NPDC051633 TaxID=3155670 RepID=UPI003417DBBB